MERNPFMGNQKKIEEFERQLAERQSVRVVACRVVSYRGLLRAR